MQPVWRRHAGWSGRTSRRHGGSGDRQSRSSPALPNARIAEGAIDPPDRSRQRLALARLVVAAPALSDGTQPFDALVADRDRLRPPHRCLVPTAHVLGDGTVRPPLRAGLVEHPDPAIPVAPGLGLDGGVLDPGELLVAWRRRRTRLGHGSGG